MIIQAETKQFVTCPVCKKYEWQVDQCKGCTSFGPWKCEKCNNHFIFIARPDLAGESFDVEQDTGLNGTHTPITVTLRSATTPPITVKINTWKYGHSQNDAPEQYVAQQQYFYDEHTCPTNWVRDIVQMEFQGDHDPHGVFEFVSVTDGHFVDPD